METEALLMIYDIWCLRYLLDRRYELTDYIRDKMKEDGIAISFDDPNKDIKWKTCHPKDHDIHFQNRFFRRGSLKEALKSININLEDYGNKT